MAAKTLLRQSDYKDSPTSTLIHFDLSQQQVKKCRALSDGNLDLPFDTSHNTDKDNEIIVIKLEERSSYHDQKYQNVSMDYCNIQVTSDSKKIDDVAGVPVTMKPQANNLIKEEKLVSINREVPIAVKSKRRSTSPVSSPKKKEFNLFQHLFDPVTKVIEDAKQNILNLTKILTLSHLNRRRLNARISANLILLQEARTQSDIAKLPESREKRCEFFTQLGDFGMALFAPLESIYEYDSLVSKNDKVIQLKTEQDTKRIDSFASFQSFLKLNCFSGFCSSKYNDVENDDDNSVDTSNLSDVLKEVILTPEDPSELKTCPHILTQELMYDISQKGLPSTCQSRTWKRLYSLSRDGDSFDIFLDRVKDHKATLIVIRTSNDMILGGFADSTWERQKGFDGRTFFGGGQSFLFSVKSKYDLNDTNEYKSEEEYLGPSNDVAQVNDIEVEAGADRLNIYKWTGANGYNQLLCYNNSRIAMGGGGESGAFGLCIENYFCKGSSGACDTFGNPPLGEIRSSNGDFGLLENYFEVIEMDVYGFIYSWY